MCPQVLLANYVSLGTDRVLEIWLYLNKQALLNSALLLDQTEQWSVSVYDGITFYLNK